MAALERWVDPAAAAALAFLALLVIGGVLLLAATVRVGLPAPRGGLPEAFGAVAVASLAVLGAPVHIGGVSVWCLPMGACALACLALGRLGAGVARRSGEEETKRRVLAGARVGGPFALICLVAALVFRLGGGSGAGASPGWALLMGGFWGTVSGAAGAFSLRASARDAVAPVRRRLNAASRRGGAALDAAGAGLAGALAAGAVIAGLALAGAIAGSFSGLGAADAFASLLVAIAFYPNIVIWLVCMGLGAPLDVGAGLTVAGKVAGPSAGYSVFGWGGAAPPGWAFLLLIVPLAAGILAARRAGRERLAPSRSPGVGVAAGAAFGAAVFVAALAARAHVTVAAGASRGFAEVGPGASEALAFGALWVGVAAAVGVAIRRAGRPEP
jgi:hypothetical protein